MSYEFLSDCKNEHDIFKQEIAADSKHYINTELLSETEVNQTSFQITPSIKSKYWLAAGL